VGREGGMPRERSDMRRIREVLRLCDEFGASVRRIAAACRMPRTLLWCTEAGERSATLVS
jgi:hypothetical protein